VSPCSSIFFKTKVFSYFRPFAFQSEDSHDASVTNITGEDSDDDGDDDPTPPPTGKIKRSEMPSWDDIVFGAKSDEDPA